MKVRHFSRWVLLLALASQSLIVGVIVLVALALILALVLRAVVGRKPAAPAQLPTEKPGEQESGRTLSEGLARTRGGFMARLNAFVGGARELDDAALGELEEILFSADVGVRTATALLESVRDRLKRKELGDLSKVKSALREEIERILSVA